MSEPSESSPSRPATPLGALPDIPNTRPAYRFTYDTGSRRPGPESVSGMTDGRGADYFGAPPKLGFLNTSSVALALGALPAEWSSSKHGFHAISTVLNNPHKKQAPPKAHSSLPAVPPADLPRVRRKDFDSYLKAIGPEWERFERNTHLGRDGVAQLEGPMTPRPSQPVRDTGNLPTASSPSQQAQFMVFQKTIPPLETVPPIFFESDFNLGDPRTFAIVTEQSSDSHASDALDDPSTLAHSLPLLEKFSHYADTVEQHLIREIALRSTSFFAALTNLNDLQTESEQCLARIASLRSSLKEVDEEVAKKGLEVVKIEAKVGDVQKVREGMKVVNDVVEMSTAAKNLVNAGQWSQALGVIEVMEQMWRDEPPTPTIPPKAPEAALSRRRSSTISQRSVSTLATTDEEEPQSKFSSVNIPISSLRAFSALPAHLQTLTVEIANSLSSDLVSVMREDLLNRMNHKSPNGQVPNGSNGIKFSLEDRLRPLLQGLVRTRGVKEATLSWREIVMGEIKEALRREFPNRFSHENGLGNQGARPDGWPVFVSHLQRMSHAEFMDVLKAIYVTYLSGVEGLHAQNQVFLDVLHSINSPNLPSIPMIEDELTDILSSAAELAHTHAAKGVICRAEQHATLELPEFLSFFRESWSFVVKCEVICRKMIVGLRGVVVSQAKLFLQTFHQARITRSARLVEDEQWNVAEVSPTLQRFTNIIVDCAIRDSPDLIIPNDTNISATKVSERNGLSAPPPSVAASPSAPAPKANGASSFVSKHLRIEDRAYFVVSATAEVLILLLDYVRIVLNLSMLTSDTMSRVIEFLKAFNSRTCQVVLGAGALRSAGLKNITARHLALASQSLTVMFELIPYIRETLRRHLSSQQAIMLVEFDKLKRDFQEHQNEIHAKLIAIMGDRITFHIGTLQGVDWNVPKPGGGVNDYMELLVKETVTLHKVLSRYLSTQVVEYVMTQVFAAINHRLSEEYTKIELPHQEAKERLLADARFLHQKLSVLKNTGMFSTMLEIVISEKRMAKRDPPIPTPTRSNTLYNVGNSANQRLKGLLAAKIPPADKALPSNPQTPATTSRPSTPLKSNSIENGFNGAGLTATSGFKQVEAHSPRLGPPEAQGQEKEPLGKDQTAATNATKPPPGPEQSQGPIPPPPTNGSILNSTPQPPNAADSQPSEPAPSEDPPPSSETSPSPASGADNATPAPSSSPPTAADSKVSDN